MKKVTEIVKDIKNAFVFTTGFIRRDSIDIRRHIERSRAEMNCKRILGILPVFLVFNVLQIVRLMTTIHHATFWLSMTVTISLMVVAFVCAAIFIWRLYGKKKRRREKCWRCNFTYRFFWCIWIAGMICIAYCNMVSGWGGGTYIFFCIVVCLVPLYPLVDWLISLSVFAVILVISAFEMNWEAELFFYNCMVILIMGFIAQRFEMIVWTQREYIYTTAFLDPLIGLLNRRGGNAFLQKELGYRGESRAGVIMLDVDFFKKYNDALGHEEGDNCLKMVSAAIQEAVKERTRLIVRHGGEEFIVLLLDATEEETKKWAEKIRKTVYNRALPTPHREVADVVTVSVGATVMTVCSDDLYEDTLNTVDAALYAAKEAGRNQVVFRC